MALTLGISFLAAFAVSVVATLTVRRYALRTGIVDRPDPGAAKKVHSAPIPLLGGLAVFSATAMVAAYHVLLGQGLDGFPGKLLAGLFLAGILLMAGGYLDDRFQLRPSRHIWFVVAACLAVMAAGMGVREITNPFGGTISLVQWEHVLAWVGDTPLVLTLVADAFVFLWLMGMTYTTKFVDGLDGLSSGIAVVASLAIFFLSMSQAYFQPHMALLSVIFLGAVLGFLVFNFHPARIFIGDGGSMFLGFMIGSMAVMSGGKIATALLVMGIPILDVAWNILRRALWERRSPAGGDRKHLHHRLFDLGLSQRQVVVIYMALAASFGATTLFLQSRHKLIALGALFVVMVALAAGAVRLLRKKNQGALP